jgi:hypothetical protein
MQKVIRQNQLAASLASAFEPTLPLSLPYSKEQVSEELMIWRVQDISLDGSGKLADG